MKVGQRCWREWLNPGQDQSLSLTAALSAPRLTGRLKSTTRELSWQFLLAGTQDCSAMTIAADVSPSSDRELVLARIIDAPPEKLFRAWTEPALLMQWFTPRPWTVSLAQTDVRAGGSSLIVMRSPDGEAFPNRGVYLEVVPNERIVFTDAYTEAWEPSEKPFMTAILTFEDLNGRTKYTARVRHWTVTDREAHEKMGFHEGWAKATDQLAELAATL